MPPTVNLLGLDLGKEQDPAALAALSRYARAVPNDMPEWCYTVIGLKSFPLGTTKEEWEDYENARESVFTNCNVCGRKLHGKDEELMGMCERCADE